MKVESRYGSAPGWLGVGLVLVLGGLLLTAAFAFAAKPAKGKTYSGVIRVNATVRDPISFKVSSSGAKVIKFSFPSGYPIYCQGGGFGIPQTSSARISNRGTFKAKLPIVFTPTHTRQGFLKVSGRFRSHKREKGRVVTDFTHSPSCNGTSKYATRAQ